MTCPAKVGSQHVALELGRAESVEIGRVGQRLGDDRATSLGVARELDLDDHRAPRGLHADDVRIAAAEGDLAAEDDEPRRTGERKQLGLLGHQAVERGFVGEARRLGQLPPGAFVLPEGHQIESLRRRSSHERRPMGPTRTIAAMTAAPTATAAAPSVQRLSSPPATAPPR